MVTSRLLKARNVTLKYTVTVECLCKTCWFSFIPTDDNQNVDLNNVGLSKFGVFPSKMSSNYCCQDSFAGLRETGKTCNFAVSIQLLSCKHGPNHSWVNDQAHSGVFFFFRHQNWEWQREELNITCRCCLTAHAWVELLWNVLVKTDRLLNMIHRGSQRFITWTGIYRCSLSRFSAFVTLIVIYDNSVSFSDIYSIVLPVPHRLNELFSVPI